MWQVFKDRADYLGAPIYFSSFTFSFLLFYIQILSKFANQNFVALFIYLMV